MRLETLAEIVAEMTTPHARTVDTEDGQAHGTEEALLVLLRAAVGSSMGRGSAAGARGTGAPLDLTAMELWGEIERTVRWWAPTAEGTVVETVAELGRWAQGSEADPAWAAEYRERLMSWRDRIRETLEPVRTTDLRDTRCPACGNLHARRLLDGEAVRRPTLHVTYSDPPVAVCLTCLSTWTGGELLDLRDGRV